MKRAKKLLEWYFAQTLQRRILVTALLIIVLLAVAEIIIFSVVWVQTLKAGLAIFAQPAHDEVSLLQGEETTIGFTVAVQNAPLCTASCNWTITNQQNQQLLASGAMTDSGRIQKQVTASVRAPENGLYTSVVQLQVFCENQPTLRCQKETEVALASATTTLHTYYSEEKKAPLTQLETDYANWQRTYEPILSQLTGIATLNNERISDLQTRAKTQAEQLKNKTASIQQLVNKEAFSAAQQVLAQPENTNALQEYDMLIVAQTQAVIDSEWINQQQELLNETASLLAQEEYLLLKQALRDATKAAQNDNTTLQELFAQYSIARNQTDNARIQVQQQLLHYQTLADAAQQQEEYICAVYQTVCPQPINSTGLQLAYDACEKATAIPVLHTSAAEEYVQQEFDNKTLAQARKELNVSDIEHNHTFWEEFAQKAQNNTLNASIAERLAYEPTLLNTSLCSLQRKVLQAPPMLNATLPESPTEEVVLPTLHTKMIQCCSVKGCSACQQAPLPVIFVHGHSFAQASAPEYSLQAFTLIAEKLQDEGRLFAGSVFPGTTIPKNVYAQLPGGVSITATYYYDSFAQQGATTLIPRKTERIETYAIRLKEAVEITRTATNADKVIIVAHSMGGLVARDYITLFGQEHVAGLVLIGTPNYGLPKNTQRICPLIGADLECQDMQKGSLFLEKLNAQPKPQIPILVIAGRGCDGDSDGVVGVQDVLLNNTKQVIVNGTCPSNTVLLHSNMLDPKLYPQVYDAIHVFIQDVENIQ